MTAETKKTDKEKKDLECLKQAHEFHKIMASISQVQK